MRVLMTLIHNASFSEDKHHQALTFHNSYMNQLHYHKTIDLGQKDKHHDTQHNNQSPVIVTCIVMLNVVAPIRNKCSFHGKLKLIGKTWVEFQLYLWRLSMTCNDAPNKKEHDLQLETQPKQLLG
jgi:hypothetical protein